MSESKLILESHTLQSDTVSSLSPPLHTILPLPDTLSFREELKNKLSSTHTHLFGCLPHGVKATFSLSSLTHAHSGSTSFTWLTPPSLPPSLPPDSALAVTLYPSLAPYLIYFLSPTSCLLLILTGDQRQNHCLCDKVGCARLISG